MRSAPWFGSIMIMRFFKLWILLLFRWVCCTKAVFYFDACDSDGNCDWYPNSVYSGCVDWIILHFSYFDLSSSLDLTCSTVQQIQIESSDCSCDSLRRVLKGDHLPELIIGRSVCVSSNSCTFLTYSISTSSVLRNLTIAFNEMLTPSTSICWYLFIYYFLLLLFAGTHNRLQRVIDLDGDYEQTCRWGSWITGRLLSHTMDIFCTFIQ